MKKQSLILAVILALGSVLSSCGSETTGQTGTTTAADEATAAEETTSRFVADELPELNFGGITMNVVVGDYFGAYWDDLYAEEATGSRLSDAIYNVRLAVEQRLNVRLNYVREEYDWGSRGKYLTKITSQILAGDGDIDLLLSQNNFTSRLSEGQYFADLRNVEHIDFEKPWYNQSALENMPDGELPFVIGEFSLANIKNAFVVYYNNDLKETLGIDTDLYALVDEGKWTADAMQSVIKDAYADLNGNSEVDPADRFGLTFGDLNKYVGFIKAFGVDIYKKESDGRYKFEFGSERAVNTVDFIQKLNPEEYVLPGQANNDNFPDYQISTGGGNYASKPFVEGRALLSCGLIADAAVMVPELTFNWGLLPYPKFDETQNSYNSVLQRVCHALIPVTAPDLAKSGALLEAISSETYRSLVPEYCEVSLKVRYSPDDNVSRMFDMAKDNIVYDPGEIFNDLLDYPSAVIRACMLDGGSWATEVAKIKPMLDEKMSTVCEVIE